MKPEAISVKTQGKPEMEFTYNFSETLPEAIEMYGPENTHELFKRALTIAAQANARKMLAAGLTAERIQNDMSQWKPGVSVRLTSSIKTVDPVKVISENFDDWTPERQEEILRLIQERFAKRGTTPAESPAVNGSEGEPEPTAEEIATITEGVNGDPSVVTEVPAEPQPTEYDPAAGRSRRNR
jgi:hypothetical protein